MHRRPSVTLVALLGLLPGCSFFESIGLAPDPVDHDAVKEPDARAEPPVVVVQHVLVSFADTDIRAVTRTKDEAARLAQRVFDLAAAGRDFSELVRLYSDDRHGDGTYTIVNWGVAAGPDGMERERLAPDFTRTAFALEPGQVALCAYDPATCKSGWHVLRRVR